MEVYVILQMKFQNKELGLFNNKYTKYGHENTGLCGA